MKLIIDMGALEEIEQATGANAFESGFWESFSASKVVAVVAAGLAHTGASHEDRLKTARALPLKELQATVTTITAAVQESMPDADQLAEAESAS